MAEKFEKKVELVAWLQNPETKWDAEDAAAHGARGCFSEKSVAQLQQEEIQKPNYGHRKEVIFAETSGREHGAVLDQSCFTFSIDNLTRASTLFLCAPEYACHLQQSLRRATAERGFHIPEGLDEKGITLMKMQFELYEKMQKEKIPAEDARFILPLYTKTAIETTLNARELQHLDSISRRDGIPTEVRNTIEQMVSQAAEKAPRMMQNRVANYEVLSWYPSSQLFARKNNTICEWLDEINRKYPVDLIDYTGRPLMSSRDIDNAIKSRDEAELANLKHYHFTFMAQMSLAAFHQATRQRTWNQSVEPLDRAITKGNYVIPPTIGEHPLNVDYKLLSYSSIEYAQEAINKDNHEAIGVVPHSLIVGDLIHINGWNAIHSIGKRTCTEAQWEIRGIAQKMAEQIREVRPEIGRYAVPQGQLYGRCPEKKPCGLCKPK